MGEHENDAKKAATSPAPAKKFAESPARVARRRRMEIRRLKVIAYAQAAGNESPRRRCRCRCRCRTPPSAAPPSSAEESGDGLRWGYACVGGRRPEMEDAVAAVPSFLSVVGNSLGEPESGAQNLHFFGVYDGHGGSQVAELCKKRLHEALAEEWRAESDNNNRSDESEEGWETRWRRILVSCFNKVDEESARPQSEAFSDTVGSTAAVAVLSSTTLIVSNCGDSRVVLSIGGRALPLSSDHKPQRPDELARIEAAGGRVIDWNGHRVLGVLAVSRAIGDHYMKPYVTAEPEVTFRRRTCTDEFLVLASDGLWDAVSNDAACDAVRQFLRSRSHETASGGATAMDPCMKAAAEHLAAMAVRHGSSDNISVVVVDLSSSSSSS